VARASWLVGVSVRRYRELEDGEEYPSYGCGRGWSMYSSGPRSFA